MKDIYDIETVEGARVQEVILEATASVIWDGEEKRLPVALVKLFGMDDEIVAVKMDDDENWQDMVYYSCREWEYPNGDDLSREDGDRVDSALEK